MYDIGLSGMLIWEQKSSISGIKNSAAYQAHKKSVASHAIASYSVERRELDDIQRINMHCRKSRVLQEKLAFGCDVEEETVHRREGAAFHGHDP